MLLTCNLQCDVMVTHKFNVNCFMFSTGSNILAVMSVVVVAAVTSTTVYSMVYHIVQVAELATLAATLQPVQCTVHTVLYTMMVWSL